MSSVLFRQIPGSSAVHELWAGTKMIAVLALSLVLMFWPSWLVLGIVIAFLLAAGFAARIPLAALPRPPWWFWASVLAGAAITAPIGPTAVVRYFQVAALGFALLSASFLVAWTTPLGEIAPAAAALGSPLRKLGLPVDEWAVAIALCLRCIPLLVEEMRILYAARRLRPNGGAPASFTDNGLLDIVTAVLAVSLRRASELAQAITARGGTGQLTAYQSRPRARDAVAFTLLALVCGGAVVLEHVVSLPAV